jgi:hypothetical protein
MKFGLLLPNRGRPYGNVNLLWKVAREIATLDHLSHGRAVLGVGLGDGQIKHPSAAPPVGTEQCPSTPESHRSIQSRSGRSSSTSADTGRARRHLTFASWG